MQMMTHLYMYEYFQMLLLSTHILNSSVTILKGFALLSAQSWTLIYTHHFRNTLKIYGSGPYVAVIVFITTAAAAKCVSHSVERLCANLNTLISIKISMWNPCYRSENGAAIAKYIRLFSYIKTVWITFQLNTSFQLISKSILFASR